MRNAGISQRSVSKLHAKARCRVELPASVDTLAMRRVLVMDAL
jgi:hypothetical protein